MNTKNTQNKIENFQAQILADLKAEVKTLADFAGLIDKKQNESAYLFSSLVLSALNSLRIDGNLSGLTAVLNLASRYKFDIKGFKQWANEIGLAGAIKKDSETLTYSFKKGFKPSFYNEAILKKFDALGIDGKEKIIFTAQKVEEIFVYIEVKKDDVILSKNDVILKLSAKLAELLKQQDINASDFQTALMLAKYEAKERVKLLAGEKVAEKKIDRPNLAPSHNPDIEKVA